MFFLHRALGIETHHIADIDREIKPTSRIARVTKFLGACREAAIAPAKSIWLKITPPKIVPRALVSRGSMVTRSVGSSAIR